MISGSRAALSISVRPSASTAAMSRFSVAPTLGKSSQIVAPVQPLRLGHDEAVLVLDRGAHLDEAGDVEVEWARADRVPTRHRHVGLTRARDERSQYGDRRAHLANQVVVGPMVEFLGHVDRDGGRVKVATAPRNRAGATAPT